jgi:hypothetical protein
MSLAGAGDGLKPVTGGISDGVVAGDETKAGDEAGWRRGGGWCVCGILATACPWWGFGWQSCRLSGVND